MIAKDDFSSTPFSTKKGRHRLDAGHVNKLVSTLNVIKSAWRNPDKTPCARPCQAFKFLFFRDAYTKNKLIIVQTTQEITKVKLQQSQLIFAPKLASLLVSGTASAPNTGNEVHWDCSNNIVNFHFIQHWYGEHDNQTANTADERGDTKSRCKRLCCN